MIADTTFLVHFIRERLTEQIGPARTFFVQNREEAVRTTQISLGEVAVSFPTSAAAWDYFKGGKNGASSSLAFYGHTFHKPGDF